MKVCLISPYPPQQDGISEYTRSLAEELSKKARVIVLAERVESPATKAEASTNVQVWRVSDRNSPIRPLDLFRVVLSERPDVVHIQYESYGLFGVFDFITTPMLLILLQLTSSKVFVTVHSFIESPGERKNDFDYVRAGSFGKLAKYAYQVLRMTVNMTFRFTHPKLIVSTEFLRHRISEVLKSHPDDIEFIPIGFRKARETISKSNARARLGVSAKKIILYFGFISAAKNVHHLLEAAGVLSSMFPECLTIVSGLPSSFDPDAASYCEKLRRMAHGADKVMFIQKFSGDDEIRLLFSSADLVVLTYPGAKGGSAVLSLALSYSLPVIVPNGGTSELEVRLNKVGLVYENGNVTSLVNRIATILFDESLATSLSQNARQIASTRTWDVVAAKTIDAYFGSRNG